MVGKWHLADTSTNLPHSWHTNTTIDTLYDKQDHTHRNRPASSTWQLAPLTQGLP